MIEKLYHISISLAASPKVSTDNIPQIGGDKLIENVLNTAYFVAGVAAVIAIIMGGFWYVTSNGDASKVQKGKNAIIYASIGLIVIMFAFGITGFVVGRF
ncbi:TPA: hypothetical protein DEW05_00885 [Candidatus Saccharibacteria bacterium]|nr:hypothetical protein [Candidatus Saccharibacteria bacterium]